MIRFASSIAIALAAIAFVSGAHAQTTYTWTSTGTGGNWSTATWTNGVPVEAADTTIQFFAGTSGAANTVTADFTATNDIKADGTSATSFDLQSLVLNGTGTNRTVTIGPSGATTPFNFIGASNAITFNSAGSLVYTVSNNIAFANGLTINGSSTAINGATFQSNRITGAVSGTGGVTKSGNSTVNMTGVLSFSGGLAVNSGRLDLGAANTFTGGTTLTAGRIVASNNSALGSGTLTLNGGVLTYGGLSSGQTRTLNNALVIGGDIRLTDSSVQGGGNLVLSGSTVSLAGASRVIQINATSTNNALSNENATISGVISDGGGSAGITKSGQGILILSNAGNTYTGVTTVRQGTLRIGANAPDGANGALGNSNSAVQLGDSGTSSANTINLFVNGAFTVGRSISVNNFNATGTTTIGGINTSGVATFSGDVALNKNVTLQAATAGTTTDFSGLIDDGAGSFAVTTGGSGTVQLSNSSGNAYDGGTVVGGTSTLLAANTSGSATGSGAVDLSSGAKLQGTSGASVSGQVNLAGNNTVSSTAGTFTLGSMNVSGSGNNVGGTVTTTGGTTVNSGASLTVNGTLGGSVALSGSIGGSGTVTGTVTVNNGSTLSPGNSPGALATGSQIWNDGGNYNWQLFDAAGTAGTGYDTLTIGGVLDLSSLTGATKFNINLWSLSSIGPDVNGDALNFDNSVNAFWTLASASGGITGFDSSDFLINLAAVNGTGGFSNALAGGTFSLSVVGDDLRLNFTAVPEPSVCVLFGLGFAAVGFLYRRRAHAVRLA